MRMWENVTKIGEDEWICKEMREWVKKTFCVRLWDIRKGERGRGKDRDRKGKRQMIKTETRSERQKKKERAAETERDNTRETEAKGQMHLIIKKNKESECDNGKRQNGRE